MSSPYRTAGEGVAEESEPKPDLSACTCPTWVTNGDASVFPHHVECPIGRSMGADEIAAAIATWYDDGEGEASRSDLEIAIAWALENHGPLFEGGGSAELKRQKDAITQCIAITETLRQYWRSIGRTEAAEACTAIAACVRTFADGVSR